MKSWTKRIAIGLGGCIGLLVVGGAIVEAVVRQQIAQQYPVPGTLVDIGGRKIQLDCRGSGSPTVVLEAGLGNLGSLSWAAVQDSIAETTRTCSYSRAGIMWSDRGPDGVERTAQDLHTALTNAGEQTPWVMVGHSLGGPYVMKFTSLYDAEVVGVVLVDASHPEQIARFRNAIGDSIDREPKIAKIPPLLADAAAQVGIVRLLPVGGVPDKTPPIVKQMANAYLPQTVGANLRAVQSLKTTLSIATDFRQLGDRLLVVLTAMQTFDAEALTKAGMNVEEERKVQETWKVLQDDMATWSRHSRHEWVDSSHNIQFDRPDVVIKAVREVVTEVRTATKR